MTKKYEYGYAIPDDFDDIVAIEEERLGDYPEKYDLEFIKKWYKHNPGMFLVVREVDTRKVVAFTITAPITEEAYNLFMEQKIFDMDDSWEDYVLKSDDAVPIPSKYFYFADICMSEDRVPRGMTSKVDVLFTLYEGIGNILDPNKTGVEHIVSTAITEEGFRASTGMNFECIGSATKCNRTVYTMRLNVSPTIIALFTRKISRFSRKKINK